MVFDPSLRQQQDYDLAISFGIGSNPNPISFRDEWYRVSALGSQVRQRLEAVGGNSSWTLQQLEEAEKPKTVPESASIAVTPSDNTVFINWNPHSDGGLAITGYHLVLKNQDTGKTITELNTSYNTTSTLLQNLDSGTNYKAYIIVINSLGNSPENSIAFKTTGSKPIIIVPQIIISTEVQVILNKFNNNDYTFPTWFNSTIGFVKDGAITNQEFLNSFNSLLQNGTIVDKTIIIPPEPVYNFIIESDGLVRMFRVGAVQYTEIKVKPESVQSFIDRGISRLLTAAERAIPYPRPEPEPTFCVNAYNIRDTGSVYSTTYNSITAAKVAELKLTQFVLSCETTTLPTEKEIQDFYGFIPIPPEVDTSINSTMVSQSVGAFILKDGIIKGEILYIANQSFNPFYYGKNLTSLVQIKSKSGVVVTIKPNVLNFTETERDERIQIDESAGNFKELLIDFFVWDSAKSQLIFAETKQIQIVDETDIPPTDPFDPKPPTTCQAGYHKDFSGKCVIDNPVGEIPRDKLIDTLKGFLFGTLALSLLARKY
jgi:hypothetical protein